MNNSSSTMRFYFVGSESHIGEVRVTAFGQALDLDPQTAHDCVMGRVGLVTEDEFKAADLSEEELMVYSEVISHKDAPKEFLDKKRKLHMAAVAFYKKYQDGVEAGITFMNPAPVVQPPKPTSMIVKSQPQPQSPVSQPLSPSQSPVDSN